MQFKRCHGLTVTLDFANFTGVGRSSIIIIIVVVVVICTLVMGRLTALKTEENETSTKSAWFRFCHSNDITGTTGQEIRREEDFSTTQVSLFGCPQSPFQMQSNCPHGGRHLR
jgi:hypothetical protein